ncbi:beta-1,3-galactosyl-O-glycosyl-glycoprotein beta-1,6-N-acetylglucosaminyltransferase 4 [Sceloporus undulatus]|uniref:beta-1,3-galactosyl-O-glycosyl-glycoprotein beta-1,6-N-acetylglucosaminyltransferase 4 n=1 Tax=Sceloporus undulatus TaxID=8520 RepID=UPI001C4B8880|nr:beta-1,3-galactosyl-O-glycosyl-glycoprotein beta-1,6-N-acetylglucosaminyltransferase 4 [Sceloporus undulatus]XP_042307987.1 beta-1,3-galactosyl-O-glycosyl-glycoprotein beta-1,6-N-acetylglucosaminyltransferase 4 [Sceloporus undulatus]XP_042307988.1 beta-1,3-galactosyl-O-glycosyl-glycoprotein beta-1,6-N-acetylglucosaminyltransferase 4 [Sceloporus undulatus]XP_042307989.1 beta-1,3-galactosyl-O-glycosyl-glycoprotein beta-1,6-N-acetylglucosaminyltransferase 4 [Sceloporus undulatus]
MKRHKWSYSYPRGQRLLILFSTVWLFLLLKLLKVEQLLLSHKDIYFVEPLLSTSSYVKNKYTNFKKDGQYEINCSFIYSQEPVEIGKTLEIKRKEIIDLDDEDVVAITSDCQVYHTIRGYQLKPISLEEKKFPLAYSLVVHKNAIMVERLIHTIYSSQNVYCIHVDQKSSSTFKRALENLAKCFSNIFIASKLEVVEYAYVSRLQADLNCLSDLLKSSIPWKYVINLCGQDFPLKSNFELVSELKRLNGGNMLETVKPSTSKRERFTYHYELQKMPYEYTKMPVKTNVSKDPPPHNIEMFVGSAYFVLSRAFVEYVLASSLAQDFFEWSKDTYSPDEHFWATLVRVPGTPGQISQEAQDITDLQSKTRLVKWNYLEDHLYPPCTGTHLRSVCIYGAAELRWLINSGHWFANKFDSKVDPVLIKCLAEKLAEQQKEWVDLSSENIFVHRTFTDVS